MKRPMLKVSANNNSYCRIKDANGNVQRVMIPDEIAEVWDDVLDVEIGLVQYNQRTVDGKLVEEDWSRLEIIDYTTIERDLKLINHQAAKDSILAKAKVNLENVSATI